MKMPASWRKTLGSVGEPQRRSRFGFCHASGDSWASLRPEGLLLGWSLKGIVHLFLGLLLVGQSLHTHLLVNVPPLQVEWENVELKGQLLGVTQERDSALLKSQGLQSKLESLEQVLKVRDLWHKEKVGQEAMCGALGPEGGQRLPASVTSSLSFCFNRGHLEQVVAEVPWSSVSHGNGRVGKLWSCVSAYAGGGPAAAAAGGGA